jgi:hypothetical protein
MLHGANLVAKHNRNKAAPSREADSSVDSHFSATRKGWSERSESCDEFMKFYPSYPTAGGKQAHFCGGCRRGHSLSLAPLLGALLDHHSGLGGSA